MVTPVQGKRDEYLEGRSSKARGLAPGQGRVYPMGRISAVFKADGRETESRYSVSGGGLTRAPGPGAHSHAEDDLFYVIEGNNECSGRRGMG